MNRVYLMPALVGQWFITVTRIPGRVLVDVRFARRRALTIRVR